MTWTLSNYVDSFCNSDELLIYITIKKKHYRKKKLLLSIVDTIRKLIMSDGVVRGTSKHKALSC